MDQNGTPVIGPGGAEPFGFVLGAVHRLATLQAAAPDVEQAKKEFLFLSASLVGCNIDALAHPFRVFRRSGVPAPRELYGPLADLLARAGVAAEVNFHTHQPDPAFFRLCVEKGVKLSLGSDAHNLYEVGEFHPHLDFLKNDCGFSGDLRDILL